jgi:hypothetical protein
VDTLIARRINHSFEPLVAQIFFVDEPKEEMRALGIKPWPTGYFASRAWAFGRCAPDLIHATFYNFTQSVSTFGIPECWELASPEEIGAARDRAVVRALTRLTSGSDLGDLSAAIALMEEAVEACPRHGRPLFAAVAGAPWPQDPPLLALWHGANKLREFRGDGHIAVLLSEGVGPVEALVIYAAMRGGDKQVLLRGRQWTEQQWDEAAAGLEQRGLVKDGRLTDGGAKWREDIELRTDQLAMAPFLALGPERSEQLRAKVNEVSAVICANGGVPSLLRKKLERMG